MYNPYIHLTKVQTETCPYAAWYYMSVLHETTFVANVAVGVA